MTSELLFHRQSDLHLQLSGIAQKARDDFYFWQELLEPLFRGQRSEVGGQNITRALHAIALADDVPFKTVKRKYYLVRQKGWLALINRALCGPSHWNTRHPVGLSAEDRELVKFYCENNQRSSHSAMKQLRRDWARKRVCPGMRHKIGDAGVARICALLRKDRPLATNGYPIGWSANNLLEYKPTRFELKAIRIGRSAAASERPLVYTTRKGLWVGSHIMIDDKWFDFEINTFVENQSGRPLELSAHDLFPAYKRLWGIRVRTLKDDSSGHHGLTERMTRYVLAGTLFLQGYSPRGTCIIAEHGMAAVRERVEKALLEMSDGLITVSRSGMTGAAAHAGQYPGIARGNSRFKASLESSHNLHHNVFAALPGQVGKDRNHQPEEHAALMRNNDALLAARKYLSAESAALLEFPLLELNQFMEIAHELYSAVHEDPDHDLEGWIECGHVEQMLCLGGQWIEQRKLLTDPAQAQLALELIRAGQLENRPRKMTRGEVWRAGAGELVRIPGYGVCEILGDDLATERKVRANKFEFEDQEVGPGVHRYESLAFTPEGEALQLRDGESYETFVNPFETSTLFVRRANGAYLGECRRIEKICRGDVEAVHRTCGAAAKVETALLQPLRERHMAEAREKLRRHATNAAVVGGKALTIEDRAARNRLHEIQRELTAEDRDASVGRSASGGSAEPESTEEISSEEISSLFATTTEE